MYHSELYSDNYRNAYNYAQTLYQKQPSLINSERLAYSGGLSGEYASIKRLFDGYDLWNNRESLFEEAGKGFYIGEYFFESAKISKDALNSYPQNGIFQERLDYSCKNIDYSPFGAELYNSFFNYSGNSNYKDGIYTQLNLNFGTIEHKFSFAVSNQNVKGKSDLKSSLKINARDSIAGIVRQTYYNRYYLTENDSLVLDTTETYNTAYYVSNDSQYYRESVYKAPNLKQNEIFGRYDYRFSSLFQAGVETKISLFKNDIVDNSQLIGLNFDFFSKNFTVKNNISISKINYSYAPIKTFYNIGSADYGYLTADDTLYNSIVYSDTTLQDEDLIRRIAEYDSMNTYTAYSVYRYEDFQKEKIKSSLNTLQFNTILSYTYQRLSVNADLTIYRLYNNNDIFKNYDKTYFYAEFGASYLFNYFGLYGGYSTGDKFLLHQSGNQYLNTSQNEFEYGLNVGLTLYPYPDWRIVLDYKENKNQDYSISSNLIGITYKF